MSLGVMLVDTSSWRNPELGGAAAGTLLMAGLFPFLALLALLFTPTMCILRTRTIFGGMTATVIAFASMIAGAWAFVRLLDSGPNLSLNLLLILPYPAIVCTQYVQSQWGQLITVIQIVLGIYLLIPVSRTRSTSE